MAQQKFFVFLQHPRKDDGETLLLSNKELWLTLSVVCLAGLKDYGY